MNGIPGRYPKVRFPIRRIEVCSGQDFERVVNENTTVSCLRCGESFLINGDTAFLQKKSLDEMPYIRCPRCSYTAAVVHYYNQAIKKERRKPCSSELMILS